MGSLLFKVQSQGSNYNSTEQRCISSQDLPCGHCGSPSPLLHYFKNCWKIIFSEKRENTYQASEVSPALDYLFIAQSSKVLNSNPNLHMRQLRMKSWVIYQRVARKPSGMGDSVWKYPVSWTNWVISQLKIRSWEVQIKTVQDEAIKKKQHCKILAAKWGKEEKLRKQQGILDIKTSGCSISPHHGLQMLFLHLLFYWTLQNAPSKSLTFF